MKKKPSPKRTALIIAAAIMFGTNTFAAIKYDYDAAGNRILRYNEIPMNAKRLADAAQEQTEEQAAGIFEEELPEMKISIFPNPTQGLLQVEITNAENLQSVEIRLYNPQVVLIRQMNKLSEMTTLDISSQADGIYVMQIVSEKNIISTWKIIKN